MNFLIHQNFRYKISFPLRRSLTCLAVDVTPSTLTLKNEELCTQFRIFSELAKFKKLTVQDVRVFHAHLIKVALSSSDVFVANSLTDWYCKSSAVDDGVQLFDEIPHPSIVSWNIMISGLNQNSRFRDSWGCFCSMLAMGFDPNQYTYGSVLSACNAMGFRLGGELIYSLSIKNGFCSIGYIRAGVIDLFATSARLEDALKVFHDFPCDQNVVCWNTMISGAVKCGDNWTALGLFSKMLLYGSLQPNTYTFSSALTACVALQEIELGKEVHGLVIKHGARERDDVFVGTAIVDLYAKCGDMEGAVKVFIRMPSPNVVSWTTIISGFVHVDDPSSAFQFFSEMRKSGVELNNFTVTSVIAACIKSNMLGLTLQVHSWILKSGFSVDDAVRTTLINMYSKFEAVDACEKLFSESRNNVEDDVGLWAAMVSAFAQNQNSRKATDMFCTMFHKGLKPDQFCTCSILSIVDCLDVGKQIHSYTLKTGLISDVSVGCSLFTMYSKRGSLEESYQVFEQIPNKDVVSWASMIAGFAEHDHANKAIQLFKEMLLEEIEPDQVTLVGVLSSFSSLGILLKGKEVHGYAIRAGFGRETLLGGALVNMYSKCGAMGLARTVFDILPSKDQVMCSALVSGYAQNGYVEEVMVLFREMLMAELEDIDSYLVSSVLGAVALLNKEADMGTQLHSLLIKLGLHSEVSVGSSLISMYSRCGSIDDCRKAFEQIINPDLIGWTTMIVSYAQNGRGTEALRFYQLMKDEGIKPDSVTFTAVLSACSHNGLVEEGYFHLNSMSQDYGIEPGRRHYACMVDVLARAGRLKEAGKFINNMPIQPDALIWGTLLAACKVHGDVELGMLAAQKVSELDRADAGAMINVSNICADMGQWEEVLHIRRLIKGTWMSKEPGWSYYT
ncbi:hypothetical protein Dimus_004889 [Dionaea muscipula]